MYQCVQYNILIYFVFRSLFFYYVTYTQTVLVCILYIPFNKCKYEYININALFH